MLWHIHVAQTQMRIEEQHEFQFSLNYSQATFNRSQCKVFARMRFATFDLYSNVYKASKVAALRKLHCASFTFAALKYELFSLSKFEELKKKPYLFIIGCNCLCLVLFLSLFALSSSPKIKYQIIIENVPYEKQNSFPRCIIKSF